MVWWALTSGLTIFVSRCGILFIPCHPINASFPHTQSRAQIVPWVTSFFVRFFFLYLVFARLQYKWQQREKESLDREVKVWKAVYSNVVLSHNAKWWIWYNLSCIESPEIFFSRYCVNKANHKQTLIFIKMVPIPSYFHFRW